MTPLFARICGTAVFCATGIAGQATHAGYAANHPALRGSPSAVEQGSIPVWYDDDDTSLVFTLRDSEENVKQGPIPAWYEQHAHLNCYSGQGGTDIPPEDGYRPGLTAVTCAEACDDDTSCSCFVYLWDQNKCFLRSQCILDSCAEGVPGRESYQFDTFTASTTKMGKSCTGCEHGEGYWQPYPEQTSPLTCICNVCEPGYMTTDMSCVPGDPQGSAIWPYEQHAHLNCYSGHGGTDISPDDGYRAGLLALDCAKACDDDASCSCFVYMWEQRKCFLRSECIVEQCEPGEYGKESYEFETFVAIPQ